MSDLPADVAEFLGVARILTLSTVGACLAPHAADLWFAVEGRALIVATPKEAQHSRNVAFNDRVAVTVRSAESVSRAEIQAIQGHAVATWIEDAGSAERGRALLRGRFKTISGSMPLLRIDLVWLRYLDGVNGRIIESNLAAGD